jgi:hypothetical protein
MVLSVDLRKLSCDFHDVIVVGNVADLFVDLDKDVDSSVDQ